MIDNTCYTLVKTTKEFIMTYFSSLQCFDRTNQTRKLQETLFDLVVIGGGITGAGIARDASLRGLKVALLEAKDFASGTSSRSSKMIHGGLRYLLKGDIAVVKESASERKILHNIAPHLAQKSYYVVTARSWYESLMLRAALTIYEWLGNVDKEDRHKLWSVDEIKQHEPSFNTEGIHSALVYIEYLTDDARLTLANIRAAVKSGAIAMNYNKVVSITKDEHFNVTLQSQIKTNEPTIEIKAKAVVNAAGPWVDKVCQLENPQQPSRLALSRGIHIVVPFSRLAIKHSMVLYANDKRILFAVPNGETTYIGTTDEFYEHYDYWPDIYSKDVDYLLATVNLHFPNNKLTTDDVVSMWSGVRPLVGNISQKATEISRKDEVWIGPMGMLSIAGGKLSAYRAMAERIVDKVVATHGFTAKACQTASSPLPGGEPLSQEIKDSTSSRLQRFYGSEAHILRDMGGDLYAEVRFAVLVEGAVKLEDYWARRSSRAWFDTDAGMASLEPASIIMAQLLGWSEEQRQAEITNCQSINDATRQHLLNRETK